MRTFTINASAVVESDSADTIRAYADVIAAQLGLTHVELTVTDVTVEDAEKAAADMSDVGI